jgi:hypothetical protein
VPYVVAYSMMWGSVLSWGIMWPLLAKKEGSWYPAGIQDGDFRGMSGYRVCAPNLPLLCLPMGLLDCKSPSLSTATSKLSADWAFAKGGSLGPD